MSNNTTEDSGQQFNEYKTLIKDIYIHLPNFSFNNTILDDLEDDRFVGRKEVLNQLINCLNDKTWKGAYLVTGYRGMGKTSLVKRSIEGYKAKLSLKERKKVIPVDVSLAQSKVTEVDILRQLLRQMLSSLDKRKSRTAIGPLWIVPMTIVLLGIFSSSIYWLLNFYQDDTEHVNSFFGFCYYFLKNIISKWELQNFILYAICILLTFSLSKFIVSKMDPYNKIRNRLDDLYKRTSADISVDHDSSMKNDNFSISLFPRKQYTYPKANSKEIENELVHILEEFSKKYKFIFVLDELDKLGLDFKHEKDDKLESEYDYDPDNDERARKNYIIGVLSSFKYLISSANAKFFFIAGREMFDVSLAEIADRKSMISSIFHKVFYVDSLIKDVSDTGSKNRTSHDSGAFSELIEDYYESVILNFPQKVGKLKSFRKVFFKKNISLINKIKLLFKSITFDSFEKHTKEENGFLKNFHSKMGNGFDFARQLEDGDSIPYDALLKSTFALQNLITFTTYRSHGSPKKMIKILEDLVVSVYDEKKLDPKKTSLIRRYEESPNHSGNYYLKLDTKTQYRFAYLSFLYRPFILSNSKYIKNYSDRLLVSIPYLIDHLIKYHPFAFSNDNLEIIPEVLQKDKTPESRHLVNDILRYLSESVVREVDHGLFTYKFINKAYHELTYLCKMFEEDSAAFNFTLDESHDTKEYLKNKILELRNIYKDINYEMEGGTYSISILNRLLGDAYYYDQEYSDSLVCYYDALKAVKPKQVAQESNEYKDIVIIERINTFLDTVVIKLKICDVYEKTKDYTSALNILIDLQVDQNYLESQIDNSLVGEDSLYFQMGGGSESYNFLLWNAKYELVKYSSMVELSILYLKEKSGNYGISQNALISFNTNLSSKIKECFDKKRYKLAHIYISRLMSYSVFQYYKGGRYINYDGKNQNKKALQVFLRHQFGIKKPLKALYWNWNVLCYRYILLNKTALVNMSKYTSSKDILQILIKWQQKIDIEDVSEVGIGSKIYKDVAISLSRIADCLFCELTDRNTKSSESNVTHFKEFIVQEFKDNQIEFIDDKDKLKLSNLSTAIILLYAISAKFLDDVGYSGLANHQWRKLLIVIRDYVTAEDSNGIIRRYIEDVIIPRVFNNLGSVSLSTMRPQIYKNKYNQGIESHYHPTYLTKRNYLSLSNSGEMKEFVLVWAELRIKWDSLAPNLSKYKFYSKAIKNDLVNQYSLINSQFSRITELQFQTKLNYKWLKANNHPLAILIGDWQGSIYKLFRKWDTEDSENEFCKKCKFEALHNDDMALLASVVMNSIYNQFSLISIYATYSSGIFPGYYAIAKAHENLAEWLIYYEMVRAYEFYKKSIDNNYSPEGGTIRERLVTMLGNDAVMTFDPSSYYQLALINYKKCKLMHTEGKTYKEEIRNMSFLEDDFEDNLYHSCIAIDRQKVFSGEVDKCIKECELELKETQLYDFKSYLQI
jgi:hypothetical protein